MARLSVEHVRANVNMTPDHARKSSRFRDIFKSRSSLSPPTLDLSRKSPPGQNQLSQPTSPTSPTVKPGFQKVGILPSERSSFADARTELEHNGGVHIAEVLSKQEENLKGVSAPHSVDTSMDAAQVGDRDDVVPQAVKEKKDANARVLAIAFDDAVATYQKEDTGVSTQTATAEEPQLRRRSGRKNLSVDEGAGKKSSESSGQAGFFDLNAARSGKLEHHMSEPCPPALGYSPQSLKSSIFDQAPSASRINPEASKLSNGIFSDAGDEIFVNTSGDRSSPHDSFASKIFNKEDSLSKGIRAYVDSKVAEAMVAHDRTHGRKAHGGGKQMHITFKIDVAGLARKLEGKIDKKPAPFTPKHLCGYTVTSPGLVHALQDIILALYILPLGYITCRLPVPLLFVFLLIVASLVKPRELYEASHSDSGANMLLAPPELARGWMQDIIGAAIMDLMRMAVECMEEVAGEADVEVEAGSKTAWRRELPTQYHR